MCSASVVSAFPRFGMSCSACSECRLTAHHTRDTVDRDTPSARAISALSNGVHVPSGPQASPGPQPRARQRPARLQEMSKLFAKTSFDKFDKRSKCETFCDCRIRQTNTNLAKVCQKPMCVLVIGCNRIQVAIYVFVICKLAYGTPNVARDVVK